MKCLNSGSPQCHLPTQLEDVSVSTIPGALSALEALCDYALYKSTFTLQQRCALGAIVVDRWEDFAISFVRLTFAESRENCRAVEILLRRALSTWKSLVDANNADADEYECDEHWSSRYSETALNLFYYLTNRR